MGHAMRSRVILDELCKTHDVQVVVSGRAYDYLQQRAGEHLSVKKIWGYSLVYEDNEVQKFKTVVANLKGALTGWPQNVRAYFDLAEKFEPQVVISDFESWSYLYAQRHYLPVLSVDNIQMVDRCAHAPDIVDSLGADFTLTKGIVRAKVPGARHYYITTFFYPPVRRKKTSLYPPVLRPEILAGPSEPGEHLLVYQTSTSNTELPRILAATGLPCRIYGLRRDIKEDVVEGNLRYRPFSERGFIDDLRTARAVVASAGFTLMGEVVYLHKPMLAVPVRRQLEQVLNARYLEAEGYGLAADELTAERLGAFIERVPDFAQRLAGYRQDGNDALFAALEGGLQTAAAGKPIPGAGDDAIASDDDDEAPSPG
jgi:uncharacterized protein (TIGR00661 family)